MILCHRLMFAGCLAVLSSTVAIHGQSLINARAVGLGAGIASVKDSRGFPANPAGMVNIKDWDFTTTTYALMSGTNGGFVFHGLTFGKRLFETEAIALQYAPGSSLRFVAPLTLTIGTPGQSISNDREIEYGEPFSLGYAHRFSATFSACLGGRFRRERIADTEYEIQVRDTITVPVVSSKTSEATSWYLDLGLLWTPSERFALGVIVRNVLQLKLADLPAELQEFRLPYKPIAALGVSWMPLPQFRVAADFTSTVSGVLGHEWAIGKGVTIRNALYFDKTESPALFGVSAGMGCSYEFVEIDAAYLHFMNQSKRSGSSLTSDFDSQQLVNLDLNPYAGDRISLSRSK